ncbi:MAG: CPBP family intramembrane metalloprotease [Luteolibacter sp.]
MVLAFILGLWMWDHYFGDSAGYAPGTEEMALVKIDRDLRLADAMEKDPAWLCRMAGARTPDVARREALAALGKLAEDRSLSVNGLAAYAVIQAVDLKKPVIPAVAEITQGLEPPDFSAMEKRRIGKKARWWEIRVLESRAGSQDPGWFKVEEEISQRLRSRALVARSAVWLLAVAGFAFLPSTVRRMDLGLKVKVQGFGSGWTPAMGLTLFLLATLAWIGFGMVLDLGMKNAGDLPGWLVFLFDTTARLLPSLIVLALIFRRPSHAGRVLGIRRNVDWGIIFGLFSLITLLDQPLRLLIDPGPPEPGGGLNFAERGWSGLALTVFSACLIAPLAEELLYRGVLFRSFANRIGVGAGALVSSVIFALLHFYNAYGLVSVGIFGFAAAVMYASTRSLTTVILFHVLYNLAIKLPEWVVYQWPLG